MLVSRFWRNSCYRQLRRRSLDGETTLCLKKTSQLWQAQSCIFVKLKHGLILITMGKQHNHTFKNYIHTITIQLSLYLQLLTFLLLNSCDGNDATPAS